MSLPKTPPATSSTKAAGPDPTASTMKTMQYIMPFFTLFIGWNLPSGLALYWTVSSSFQAVQQYFVTGWGSLLVTPKLVSSGSSKESDTASSKALSNGTVTSRNGKPVVEADEPEVSGRALAAASAASTGSNGGSATASRSSSSGSSAQSGARRSRNNSASARRRSGSQRSRR